MRNSVHTKGFIFLIIGLFIGAGTITGLSNTIETTRSVERNDGSSEITTCYHPSPIVACFEWSPENPAVNETVTFDASCSEGVITNYSWYYSCGDQSPISLGFGILITTSFPAPCSAGAYRIDLTVQGPSGLDRKSHYVWVGTVGNYAPFTPSTPSGPTTGATGIVYTYTTITSDADKDKIKYGWDWNSDGTVDNWSALQETDTICSMSHSWNNLDTYQVKVKAQDEHGKESNWSLPLTVTISTDNNPPNKPNTPTGPSTGKIKTSYSYSSSAIDPESDQVYLMFDWGDGTQSQWLGPFNSGSVASTEKTWSESGDYSVKVKAKDTFGAESEWSNPLPIKMPYSYKPLLQFLELLLERFPNTFPILRQLLE